MRRLLDIFKAIGVLADYTTNKGHSDNPYNTDTKNSQQG